MNVPYTPPSLQYISVEEVARLAPSLGYQADFAEKATNGKVEDQLAKFLSLTFAVPGGGLKYSKRGDLHRVLGRKDLKAPQIVLTAQEFEFYTQIFRQGGMNGPFNWYRTAQYRFDEEKAANLPSNLPSDLPVLFLWGTEDVTCIPAVVGKARKFINRYQEMALEGRGHWILVEARAEVTKKVDDWLRSLYSDSLEPSKL